MASKTSTHSADVSRWFFILMSVLTLVVFWFIIQSFVITLVTAAVAAIVVSPIEKRVRAVVKQRHVSAVLVVIAFILVVLAPFTVAGVLMVSQAEELVSGALGDGGWLKTFDISSNPIMLSLPEVVQEKILAIDPVAVGDDALSWIIKNLGSIFSGTAALVLHTVIFFISMYYLLSDREQLKAVVLKLSPFKDSMDEDILGRLVATVRGVVFGALIIAIIQGVLASIGLTIFGVPGALIWGGAVVLAAQVPLFGVGLILIPSIIYLFVTGQTGSAVGLLIWSGLVVGLVDNFLGPIVLKGKTHMHALLILISVLGGLELFGPVGFIIGPTVLAAVMVIMELYLSGMLNTRKSR